MKKWVTHWFKDLQKTAKTAIAPTVVAALIFLVTWRFFGMDNTMIAPFATLSYLSFRSMQKKAGCMLITFVIYLAMAAAAWLAVRDIVLCLTVNAAALFWITYFHIDEYQPANYFPAGMALIFFQIAPVYTLPALLNRIEALGISFLIIGLFVLVPLLIRPQPDRLRGMTAYGLALAGQMVKAADSGDTALLEQVRSELRPVSHKISKAIYTANRCQILPRGRVNWYCQFPAFFQCVDYFLRPEALAGPNSSASLQQARALQERSSHIFRNTKPEPNYKKLTFRYNKPDLRNFRFRFALRTLIVITPCLLFSYVSGLENVYWLVISVFFMMIPFSEGTKDRVRQRVTGSIFGILLCFVLFSVFRDLHSRIVIMTIANFFIYSASGYTSMVAYITCSAMAVQTVHSSVSVVLLERLVYTLIGAAIALLANHYIFPIRTRLQILYILDILGRIRKHLSDLPDASDSANPDSKAYLFLAFGFRRLHRGPISPSCLRHQKDQLIIKSYLLIQRLYALHAAIPADQQLPDLQEQIDHHMNYLSACLSRM
jgi:hypothetical protein